MNDHKVLVPLYEYNELLKIKENMLSNKFFAFSKVINIKYLNECEQHFMFHNETEIIKELQDKINDYEIRLNNIEVRHKMSIDYIKSLNIFQFLKFRKEKKY